MPLSDASTDSISGQLASGALDEDANCPWTKVNGLAVCFVGVVALTILRGSGEFDPLDLECGSAQFANIFQQFGNETDQICKKTIKI